MFLLCDMNWYRASALSWCVCALFCLEQKPNIVESALHFNVVAVGFFSSLLSFWGKELHRTTGHLTEIKNVLACILCTLIFCLFVFVASIGNGVRYGRKHLHRVSVCCARANKIESTSFFFLSFFLSMNKLSISNAVLLSTFARCTSAMHIFI